MNPIGTRLSPEQFRKQYQVGTRLSPQQFQQAYPQEEERQYPTENAKPVSELGTYEKLAGKLGSVATGVTKGILGSAVGLGRLAVGGTARLASISPKATYEQAKERATDILPDFLVGGSESANKLDAVLKSQNKYETYGKALEFAGELYLTGGARAVAGLVGKTAGALEKATLRLSGAQLRNLGSKYITEAVDTIKKYGPSVGSPETRAAKFGRIVDSFEDNLQASFDAIGDSFKLSKKQLIRKLELVKGEFQGKSSQFQAVKNQVDDAIKNVKISYAGDSIPGSLLNSLKRDYYRTEVYNKSGLKVIDDVAYRIADTIYDSLKLSANKSGLRVGTRTFEEFNKEYSKVIRAHNLLKAAVGKPEIGIITRIGATIVGGTVGKAVGGIYGAAAGIGAASLAAKTVAGTAAKSTVSGLLQFVEKGGNTAVKTLNTIVPNLGTTLANLSLPSVLTKGGETTLDFLGLGGKGKQ